MANQINFYRGDDIAIPLTFNDGAVTPNPINITGWTVFFTVKRDDDDTDTNALIGINVTNHINAAAGQTIITVPATQTNIKGNFKYDIKVKKNDNTIQTILVGDIGFKDNVTQRVS